MIIVKKIDEIKAIIEKNKKLGKKIAFVPTMGSLHDGHLSIIDKANSLADITIVSIFVNKQQFNDKNDYEKYPREIEMDILKLSKNNVEILFCPDDLELYPNEPSFVISLNKFNDCLCAKYRANHFNGVCLVLAKFFNILKPNYGLFGKKDFQQYLIVKKMVEDFNYDIKIIGVETHRELSGLAMSSRNKRLSDDALKKASSIFRVLNDIKNEIIFSDNLETLLQNKKNELIKIGFEKIDYLELREENNLDLVTTFKLGSNVRIFIALYIESIRLIDNLKI